MIKVIGITDLKDMTLYIATDEKPFTASSYYMIKDELLNKSIPCEVIETLILPCVDIDLLPKGISVKSVEKSGFKIDNILYLAKVKVLKNLYQPIMPHSLVTPAKYDDIKDIITNADPRDSMILGVIRGTEPIQKDLPKELSNLAPLWKNGKAINQNGVPLMINYRNFREYPNIGIFGGAGSGKSFALKTICEELMKLGIPALIFDPHSELKFEGTMNGLDDKFKFDFTTRYNEFQIGKNVGIKFEELSFSELASLFNFVGGLTEPQKNALEVLYEQGDVIENLVEKINLLKEAFDMIEGQKNKFGGKDINFTNPYQAELYYKCKNKVSGASTLQAISWKLNSLMNTHIFTCDTEEVRETLAIGKVAIIRGDISRLQMISSYLLNKMYHIRRAYVEKEVNEYSDKFDFFPPFFIIMDEAHNFAPIEGHSATKYILRKIAQEARKFGVFEILCTQRPKILDTTIVAQLSTKFIFRLTDQSDIEVAKTEGNLTNSQASSLPELKSGNCYATSALLNKTYPVLFRTTFTKAGSAKDPFKEMEDNLSKGIVRKIKSSKNDVEIVTTECIKNDEKEVIEIDKDIKAKEYIKENNKEESENEKIIKAIVDKLPFDNATLVRVATALRKEIDTPIPINKLKEIINDLVFQGLIQEEKTGMMVKYTLKK